MSEPIPIETIQYNNRKNAETSTIEYHQMLNRAFQERNH